MCLREVCLGSVAFHGDLLSFRRAALHSAWGQLFCNHALQAFIRKLFACTSPQLPFDCGPVCLIWVGSVPVRARSLFSRMWLIFMLVSLLLVWGLARRRAGRAQKPSPPPHPCRPSPKTLKLLVYSGAGVWDCSLAVYLYKMFLSSLCGPLSVSLGCLWKFLGGFWGHFRRGWGAFDGFWVVLWVRL